MCQFMIGEKYCYNCNKILELHYNHCKSIGSCSVFASFVKLYPLKAIEVIVKLAKRQKEEAESQAAALECKLIEDGKRKVNPEEGTMISEVEW